MKTVVSTYYSDDGYCEVNVCKNSNLYEVQVVGTNVVNVYTSQLEAETAAEDLIYEYEEGTTNDN